MKLVKRPNRKNKDGHYMYSYIISVNPKLINNLGWNQDHKLKANIKNNKLIIEIDV